MVLSLLQKGANRGLRSYTEGYTALEYAYYFQANRDNAAPYTEIITLFESMFPGDAPASNKEPFSADVTQAAVARKDQGGFPYFRSCESPLFFFVSFFSVWCKPCLAGLKN